MAVSKSGTVNSSTRPAPTSKPTLLSSSSKRKVVEDSSDDDENATLFASRSTPATKLNHTAAFAAFATPNTPAPPAYPRTVSTTTPIPANRVVTEAPLIDMLHYSRQAVCSQSQSTFTSTFRLHEMQAFHSMETNLRHVQISVKFVADHEMSQKVSADGKRFDCTYKSKTWNAEGFIDPNSPSVSNPATSAIVNYSFGTHTATKQPNGWILFKLGSRSFINSNVVIPCTGCT
ncbi:hypothetical protein HDU98_000823 [Podochytrium sp. JEL0797]|nr:hypothetical protein HDU98_000823 [Podochytrium sp. JEL0797]